MTQAAWRALRLLVPVLVLAFGGRVEAATQSDLTSDQLKAVEQVSTYFNSFKTLKGEFTQVSPKGRVSAGVFFLSKPGRLRFEYAPPNPFLVVSDGTWVVIEDRNQKTTDQYPLATTPLKFLLADEVNLMEEAKVVSVETADGISTIALEDKANLLPGQLVLVFDSNRNQLAQWIVEDAQGKRTTISLDRLETGVETDPKLFVARIAKRKNNR
jgi:outer membrane lipoprotein-sorting protein